MRWLALLGALVVAGVAALFMRGGPEPAPQPTPTAPPSALPPSTPSPARVPASRAVANTDAAWQRIDLRGVLFRQHEPGESQALLSQDGGRAQVFRTGEEVLQGWTLTAIQQDHVVLSKGPEQHRLDVVQTPSAAAQGVPAPAASARNPVSLPGFIPAPPGQDMAARPSLETNRRFLQDRRNRVSGATQ